MNRRHWSNRLAVALAIALAACGRLPATGTTSLYDRLGGAGVMVPVVSETVDTIVADPEVNQSFQQVRLGRVKKHIHAFICELADGPCTYAGDPIKIVHAGLGIREKEFNALVQALRDALHRHGVPESAKNELLRRLAPLKPDIVTA